ncbi:MAG TPA: L,D-transpeptidase [Tabrizicola sp.]|jgi:lipoprotein-anchoring transpeptidase ErfK/SrfK|nr:L,D-transpeptidase [Tabrizicola sp.]
MKRREFTLLLGALLVPQAAFASSSAEPVTRVVARVSISTQSMKVYHEGRHIYTWPVSTAKSGKITPTGVFAPEFLSRNHRSRRYNNAPMPWAIFYDGNYAIHGTDQIKRLGKPASHGCVRLHPDNAEILFKMVKWEGMEAMRVEIVP